KGVPDDRDDQQSRLRGAVVLRVQADGLVRRAAGADHGGRVPGGGVHPSGDHQAAAAPVQRRRAAWRARQAGDCVNGPRLSTKVTKVTKITKKTSKGFSSWSWWPLCSVWVAVAVIAVASPAVAQSAPS